MTALRWIGVPDEAVVVTFVARLILAERDLRQVNDACATCAQVSCCKQQGTARHSKALI
jgi:hypothetical protein